MGIVLVFVAKIACGASRLDVAQHRVLHVELLEHRLDHQVGTMPKPV